VVSLVAIVSNSIVACNKVIASGLRQCSSILSVHHANIIACSFRVSARMACIISVILDMPPVIQCATDIGRSVSARNGRLLICS
jgi:hypothetical protein